MAHKLLTLLFGLALALGEAPKWWVGRHPIGQNCQDCCCLNGDLHILQYSSSVYEYVLTGRLEGETCQTDGQFIVDLVTAEFTGDFSAQVVIDGHKFEIRLEGSSFTEINLDECPDDMSVFNVPSQQTSDHMEPRRSGLAVMIIVVLILCCTVRYATRTITHLKQIRRNALKDDALPRCQNPDCKHSNCGKWIHDAPGKSRHLQSINFHFTQDIWIVPSDQLYGSGAAIIGGIEYNVLHVETLDRFCTGHRGGYHGWQPGHEYPKDVSEKYHGVNESRDIMRRIMLCTLCVVIVVTIPVAFGVLYMM